MNKRLGISVAAVSAAFLLLAPAAPAATEAGWDCVANDKESNWTLLVERPTVYPISPLVPPEGPKVITGWKVRVGPGLGPIPQRLEVFEGRDEGLHEKIGESAMETLVEGINAFPTRIPADEGDRIGLYGPEGTLLCDKEAGLNSWLHEGSAAVGETREFKGVSDIGTPLMVTIEDDRDNDGFGDETQDRCPASAAYQDCPIVTPSVLSRVVRPRAILVRAQIDSDASVRVNGSVRWWKVPSGDGPRRRYTRFVPITVKLGAGLSRPLTANSPATFRLPFPKAVLRRLALLSPKKALRARITATATDLAARETTHTVVVKLRGRNKDA